MTFLLIFPFVHVMVFEGDFAGVGFVVLVLVFGVLTVHESGFGFTPVSRNRSGRAFFEASLPPSLFNFTLIREVE